MGKTRKRTETAGADTEQLWPHLRNVTFSDVRAAIAAGFALWAIISVCAVGLYWAGEKAWPGQGADWTSPLPHWANYAVLCAIALWFLRGRTLHYRIPRWTVGGWLFASLYVAGLVFVVNNAPNWATVPVFTGAWILVSMLDTLNEQGSSNAVAAAGADTAISEA
jgi:hypothetical protein